jgi:hypothetical protein
MRLGTLLNHLKAVRIPLLVACVAAFLTYWVDQIRELFYLLITTAPRAYQVGAIITSGLLGISIWLSSRTVFRFDIPALPGLNDPSGSKLREWLPPLLGASVPLIMTFGCMESTFDRAIVSHEEVGGTAVVMILAFLIEAVLLFVGLGLVPTPGDATRVRYWSDLPKNIRRVFGTAFILSILAITAASGYPGKLAASGPLSVILMTTALLVCNLTFLIIVAGRQQIPVLTVALLVVVAVHWSGCGDNHHVRLYSEMHSRDEPDPIAFRKALALARPPGTAVSPSFLEYAATFRSRLPAGQPIYLVSAEGGGIRAAAWTALVLTQLEVNSNGTFSRHVLAGSGVSGGSLGLALFAAMVKARNDGLIDTQDMPQIARQFLLTDFLRGPIETMLLTDLLQRFIPHPLFVDRGERLEREWEDAWRSACIAASKRHSHPSKESQQGCDTFAQPWTLLFGNLEKSDIVLFFNSTVVGTGRRFVQEPFTWLDSKRGDWAVMGVSDMSAGWLPDSTPLSAVVHNSARFTYVSPAGTLTGYWPLVGPRRVPLQLVDGGYFENSGAATLVDLVHLVADAFPECDARRAGGIGSDCPLHAIHISNDPTVEALLAYDTCPTARPPALASEASAPITALLNTREARGALSRHDLVRALSLSDPERFHNELRVAHFRLCERHHHLPLGWTLSEPALDDMLKQLLDSGKPGAGAGNVSQFSALLDMLCGTGFYERHVINDAQCSAAR